jgi:hypothetical protein
VSYQRLSNVRRVVGAQWNAEPGLQHCVVHSQEIVKSFMFYRTFLYVAIPEHARQETSLMKVHIYAVQGGWHTLWSSMSGFHN